MPIQMLERYCQDIVAVNSIDIRLLITWLLLRGMITGLSDSADNHFSTAV